jgi:glycerol-3-phosphate dehydrogenase
MITITGGKWTSYRLMAEDTVDRACKMGLLEKRRCVTRNLRIHGYRPNPDLSDHLYVYGSDRDQIVALAGSDPAMARRISEKYPYTAAEVVWAVRHEMALDLEDVLARRVRLLYVDAAEAIKAARVTAQIMAAELGRDSKWENEQVEAFTALANNYILQ